MLFESLQAGALHLRNRLVMSPMTRNRAVDHNTPNALMAEYYGQRASAGLIITEGTSPSPNGLGYPRIPGLFNSEQMRGWKAVTAAVHAREGTIFVQLMHTGRVTQLANLPPGAEVVGPGSEVCPGEMYTDTQGMQPHSPPRAMQEADIAYAVAEYAQAAQLAMEAGFDGVELHGANGYLIEQFLNPLVNHRTDGYGGSSAARRRASTPRRRRSTWRWPLSSRASDCATCTCSITRRWVPRTCPMQSRPPCAPHSGGCSFSPGASTASLPRRHCASIAPI